jgi:hypothetical protein
MSLLRTLNNLQFIQAKIKILKLPKKTMTFWKIREPSSCILLFITPATLNSLLQAHLQTHIRLQLVCWNCSRPIEALHVILMTNCQFQANWCSESHASLIGVNELLWLRVTESAEKQQAHARKWSRTRCLKTRIKIICSDMGSDVLGYKIWPSHDKTITQYSIQS